MDTRQNTQHCGVKRRRSSDKSKLSSTSSPTDASASTTSVLTSATSSDEHGCQQSHPRPYDVIARALRERRWKDAVDEIERQHQHGVPPEAPSSSSTTAAAASTDIDPSPLALACRFGAPYECVRTALAYYPNKLRRLLDSRGTPLHEAIVCESVGPDVIRLLLDADERLGDDTPRAAVMQDVDGYVPLHLLIRRRFQSHVLENNDNTGSLMEILEMLVRSCAEAVVVPDRGEYEEPPIVMALKANVYAPLLQSEDETIARIERNIHEMVRCMLLYYPQAASCVFNGYRGQYTALHSAIFHGRCPETLELLLTAESQCPSSQKASLLANTQGEMPLHFCTMRGEPPRSVALLAQAAPEAVLLRDASGLTPMHWLWVRFVSNLLALDDGGRASTANAATVRLDIPMNLTVPQDEYTAFTSMQQGGFEANLQLLRRLDPSVDFFRMRHIPEEILGESNSTYWAERTIALLQNLRRRYVAHHFAIQQQQQQRRLRRRRRQQDETVESVIVNADNATNDDFDETETRTIEWTRLEAICCLFWMKVVSLLRAAWIASGERGEDGEFSIVRTAFACSCPPPIVRVVASLFPREMSRMDSRNMLPLHHALNRPWHAWDCPREDETSDSASARLLTKESLSVIKLAIAFSSQIVPTKPGSHTVTKHRLAIHYAIPVLINATFARGKSSVNHPVHEILDVIRQLVTMHPESIEHRDPVTGLLPFLQASAAAAEHCTRKSDNDGFAMPFPDEPALSVVYLLLRENPSAVLHFDNTPRKGLGCS